MKEDGQVDSVEVATQILRANVSTIGTCLNAYWKTNEKRLKSAFSVRRRPQAGVRVSKDQMYSGQLLRDLTFIIAEISQYLEVQ